MVGQQKEGEQPLKSYGLVCVVTNTEQDVLLLHRSKDKKLFPDFWHVVGAFPVQKDANAVDLSNYATQKEIGVIPKVIKLGKLQVVQSGIDSVGLIPALAVLEKNQVIQLNEEHTESVFVPLDKIDNYKLIPGIGNLIRDLMTAKKL